MQLGIDISQIVYEGSGVARFTHGLTNAICTYDKENTWTFFYSSLRRGLPTEVEKMIENSGHRLVHALFPPTLLSFLWNKMHILSPEIILGKLDWFITSDWTEPPMRVKKATIVHDLTYLRYPETVHNTILQTQKQRMRWVTKESKLIFADSIATKEDIAQYLKISDTKVVVNYPGVDDKYIDAAISKTSMRNEYGEKPFILTVGKREPRKNLDRLIQAFLSLKRDDVDLYIVGAYGWGMDVANSKLENHEGAKNIKFLGFVSDEMLSSLYTQCLGFIFPSIWEGFGYPVLEAMQHGAIVATSNTSSLKEVAGDAAILFDPLDIHDIAQSIEKLITDKVLKKKLQQKSKLRAQEFTWKRYIDTLITSLKTNS